MKYGLLATLILLLCDAAAAQSPEAPAAELAITPDLVITNVVVVSPERDAPSAPVNVVIGDGRILRITDEPVAAGTALTRIDGQGRFLVPGYIDAHVHLWEIPGMRADQERANPAVSAEARAQIPRSYLYHGFTALIDLAANSDLAERWNAQETAPRVHFCGAVTIQDGYPTARIPIPQRYRFMPNFIFDPTRPDQFPEGYERENHTPESLVSRIAGDGAICVKTYHEAGFGGRNIWPTPSVETLERIRAAAHSHGLPLMLHANSEAAQSVAPVAGVDAIVHGMWSWEESEATEPTDGVRDVLDDIIEHRIRWQPTIQVLYGEQDLQDPDYLDGPAMAHVAPQSLLDWYRSEEGQWYADEMAQMPVFAALMEEGRWQDLYDAAIARVTAALEYMDQNGGLLMFGSDTPSDVTYANPPGLNGWFEMERWLESGVAPAKLFRAATLENAAFFGLEDEIGTVEVNKRADLLLLRANPLIDGQALNMIDVVIIDGTPIDRDKLSATNQ